jgi:phenylpropionate dioxygenase-like ring-hydroxylating dioxygenase large terminal subunit
LGTGPISFRDSTSAEFYELEREAIFKRTWLNVGRTEELARAGSYLTKEIEAARASIIVVKGKYGVVPAPEMLCVGGVVVAPTARCASVLGGRVLHY